MRDEEKVEEKGRRERTRRKKGKFYEDSNLPVIFTPISLGPRLVLSKYLLNDLKKYLTMSRFQ